MFFLPDGTVLRPLYLLKTALQAEFKEETQMERNQHTSVPYSGTSPLQTAGKEVLAR